jgi:peptidoglycan/LPS O-acetylase OafA/YrhL
LIERVPGSKFLADIGRRSYSIYLLHFVFAWGMVSLLENHFGMFANTNIKFTLYYALTFGFSYACAGIIMRFIEDPGVKLGELIATYRNPQAKVNG